jgi:hypothetical protein
MKISENKRTIWLNMFVLALALVFLQPGNVFSHCDGLDGPVVKAARKALDTGNVDPVLIWVKKNDEMAIKKAFQQTLAVRKLSPEAKDLADVYFFETLVRTHRAGEGAPYSGLKPAGRDLGPAIPAADKALETGSVDQVLKVLTETIQKGLREHFKTAMAKKNFPPDNVEAGREYIESYVPFIHYVERVYEAAAKPVAGHYAETGAHEE